MKEIGHKMSVEKKTDENETVEHGPKELHQQLVV